MLRDARPALWEGAFCWENRLRGRPEILLLDPVWGRRAGHWLKFSTSNHVASVFTSRAHILPPVQGCRTSDGAGLPPQSFVCVIAGGVWRWVPDHPSPSTLIIRSYHGESTGSHPNSEVKHHWACSVLRWGTTWESQVTYVLHFAGARSDGPPRHHSAGRASVIISEADPGAQAYLLGLLAKIKCSICSYQLNL